MGDSYRPDHRRRPYHDSDNPDDARTSRARDHRDSRRRGDDPRERSAQPLDYEPVDPDSNDYYNRFKDVPRSYDGYIVPRVSDDSLCETGDKDVSYDGAPSNKFLLVRGLKPSVSETLFAKGMEKFFEGYDEIQGGARVKSLRRVLLIRERRSNQSLGYGFAEYKTLRDAQAVFEKAVALKKANKCTISSAEILIDFSHNGVFPHADYGVSERFTFKLANSDRFHTYRDPRYYASELVVNSEPPTTSISTADHASGGEKKPAKTGTKRAIETLESKSKKVKGAATATAAPALLALWQNKATELHGETEKPAAEEIKKTASDVDSVQPEINSSGTTDDDQTFAYEVEGEKPGCYLCGSEFTSTESLFKHLNQSALHASNLKDEAKRYRGFERLKNKGIDPESTIKLPQSDAARQMSSSTAEAQNTSLQYRDRAAERRQEEGKTIGFSLKGVSQKKTGGTVSGSSSDNEAGKPSYGKGMNMLQKAGWSEGEGLGAGGGITAPIDQSLYASGVGLGHENSKKGDAVDEASRMTKNDRGEFLEKTKELARKRYEQME